MLVYYTAEQWKECTGGPISLTMNNSNNNNINNNNNNNNNINNNKYINTLMIMTFINERTH